MAHETRDAMAIIRAVQNLTPKAMIDKTMPIPADPRDTELARLQAEVKRLRAAMERAINHLDNFCTYSAENTLSAAMKEPGHG